VSHQGLQLRGDLRQAFENYMGDMVSGPWEAIIENVARAVELGMLGAAEAATLDVALRRTQGQPPAGCDHAPCQIHCY
jgi:hypothetical protein